MRLAFLLIGALLLVHCAQEGAPPGGPPDTLPPAIVTLDPESGSTQIPVTVTPVITFNERVDLRSLEDGILIVPLVSFKATSNWNGDQIRLIFEEALQKDKTYVITLGTTVRDVRGNRLSMPRSYAFSTGSAIDQGEISGLVAMGTGPVFGANVWAYNLQANTEPNPGREPPDYIVQTGNDGSFAFSYLSPGVYRIFAFQDKGRDRRYDPGIDPLGLPSRDVPLNLSALNGGPIRIELAVRDTTDFRIQSVRTTHSSQLLVKFNAPVREDSVQQTANYSTRDIKTDSILAVHLAYRDPMDTTAIVLVTGQQSRSASYTLTVSGLTDQRGRTLTTKNATITFSGSVLSDTSAPTIRQTIPAGKAQQVSLSTTVQLLFSEGVMSDSDAVLLLTQQDSLTPVKAHWVSPAQLILKPDSLLTAATTYRLAILTTRIHDLAGLALDGGVGKPDTVWSAFSTVDPRDYGTVTGIVSDQDSSAQGPISVFLRNRKLGEQEIRISMPGAFRFAQVLPGNYILSAYRDTNRNSQFDLGTAIPFLPAERSVSKTDSVVVRSGWESENTRIDFPR